MKNKLNLWRLLEILWISCIVVFIYNFTVIGLILLGIELFFDIIVLVALKIVNKINIWSVLKIWFKIYKTFWTSKTMEEYNEIFKEYWYNKLGKDF